jgi:hypothetical protein
MRLNHCLAFVSVIAAGLTACGGSDLVLPNEGVAAKIDIVQGNGQTATVTSALPENLVVRVLDSRDRPVTGQRVEFTPGTGAGTISPAAPSTDADGRATAQWVLGPGTGTQTATARAVGNGAPANLTVAFTASATASRAASLAIVAGDGQTATAGTSVPIAPAVKVLDSEGNLVAGIPVTFAVTSGGGAVNPATPVATGSDGIATAVSWTLGPSAGPNTLTAMVPGNEVAGNPATFTATGQAGSAGRLAIVRQPPGTAQSGSALTPSVQIQLQDQNGNDVRQAGVAITAELASGPQGGALSGETAATNGNGLATFSGLTITGPAGSYTINFSGANLSGVTSTPVVLGAGGGSKLVFAVEPSGSATSGIALATQPQLQIEDAASNPVATSGMQVTAAIFSGPGGASLSGATAATNGSGLAAFSSLAIAGPTGAYTLLFAASGLTPVTANLTLGAGSPSGSQSSFGVSPGSITASNGGSVATVTVTARDASGNPVQGAAVAVNVSPSNGSAVSDLAPTNTSGQTSAQISSTAAGVKSVSVAINGVPVTNPSSLSLTVNPAAPSAATSSTVPSTSSPVVGQSVTLTITVKDAFGNPIPGRTVSLNGDGVKTQPAAPTNAQGVATGSATFLAAGQRSVQARVDGSPDVDLQAVGFTVQPAPTSTTLVTGDPSILVGQQVTLTATVAAAAPGSGVPTQGTVRFFDGGAQIDSDDLNAQGVATVNVSFIAAGAHQLSAVYDGSGNYAGSTSNSVTQQVTLIPTTTDVTASSASTFGETTTFTVSVSGSGIPQGSAQLIEGGTCQNPATILGGPAAIDGSGDVSFLVSGLNAGTHTVTGCYLGSGSHATSSDVTQHHVDQAGTALTITSDQPDPSEPGEMVTVEFELALTSGAGTPGGTIAVAAGGVPVCSVNVSGVGAFTCNWTPTEAAPNVVLMATYSGTANFEGSADSESHEVIVPGP